MTAVSYIRRIVQNVQEFMQNEKSECENQTSFMAARAAEKARLADVEERRLKSRVMMVNGITARLIKKHAPPEEIYKAREGVNAMWRLALKMEMKRMEGKRHDM